jgi:AcrR family transcriptional regulator
MPRAYRLGKRQPEIDRTRAAILSAARQVVTELGAEASMGKVAERAGVSRITLYNQFGSRARLLEALGARPDLGARRREAGGAGVDPPERLKRCIEVACAAWAADPGLYRQLDDLRRGNDVQADENRALSEMLAAQDLLRPGCSIKEAEDVIGIVMSFPAFDRLHKSGRRSPAAVAQILLGMASGVIRPPSV